MINFDSAIGNGQITMDLTLAEDDLNVTVKLKRKARDGETRDSVALIREVRERMNEEIDKAEAKLSR